MLPRVIPDIEYQIPVGTGVGKDYTKHNYYECLQYSGCIDKSDCEDLETWKKRGPYYHFNWPLQNNQATEVSVSTQFGWSVSTQFGL